MLFTIIALLVLGAIIYWLVRENKKCKEEKEKKDNANELVKLLINSNSNQQIQDNQPDTLLREKFDVVKSCSSKSCVFKH